MEALETVLYALGQFFTVIMGSVERVFPWLTGLILALFAMTALTKKILLPMFGSVGSDKVHKKYYNKHSNKSSTEE